MHVVCHQTPSQSCTESRLKANASSHHCVPSSAVSCTHPRRAELGRHPRTGGRHTAREWGVRELTVGPGVPVNGHPGSVRLGVERARGGVRLVRVDGHGRVAVRLKERAPGLIGLVPVARGGSVVPVYKNDRARRQCGGRQGARAPATGRSATLTKALGANPVCCIRVHRMRRTRARIQQQS